MLAVVAQIKVKPGAEAEFEKVAAELVAASRQEEGCLEYTLWRTAETGLYAFTEKYRDADAVDAHRKSEHFAPSAKQWARSWMARPTCACPQSDRLRSGERP
jgi:quinol monooxygenase YgiN